MSDKPTYEEFYTYFDDIEYHLPLRKHTTMIRATMDAEDNGRVNKWTTKALKKIETIKKVSEWLQKEHLGSLETRYNDEV